MRAAILRIGITLACTALLVACAALAPHALRRWDAFDVRRVELMGARHLTAEAAVAASGITRTASLFDDPSAWRDALLTHPLVTGVRIERRLPNTIVLHVTETVPVAFARTPELRAIDARGRILPADPAADDMNLPVLMHVTRVSATGSATDDETLKTVAFIANVRRHEPVLMGWLSEVGMTDGAVRLVLRNATDAEVLVPAEPEPHRLHELLLTLADLAQSPLAAANGAAATNATAETYLSRVKRIDMRYHDQIVVATHGGKN